MSDQVNIVIEGDEAAVRQIEALSATDPRNETVTAQVQGQFGDPNVWMLAGHVIPALITAAGPIIVELIKQRRITSVKLGETEVRDGDVERAAALLDGAGHGKG